VIIDKYQRGFPLCWTVSAFGCQHACLAEGLASTLNTQETAYYFSKLLVLDLLIAQLASATVEGGCAEKCCARELSSA
jgi:hypothetical protein